MALNWEPRLAVGVAIIDQQHKELIWSGTAKGWLSLCALRPMIWSSSPWPSSRIVILEVGELNSSPRKAAASSWSFGQPPPLAWLALS